ncbi:TMEM165/GDT1 family protein [Prochlorococcus sp. MIT 1223]|uniref:TMEM165/GDT1 family protein n=1 Tax=Prochlorococcus sp. MIT 1223 TaxID=3096217 RepID=UPI002A7572B1|nr:TMEM165/GDT1 family protein [Prochlorococcus sp. MIT 1223]
MDFTLLLSIFTTVFLAELGDKTQLATFALSGSTNKPYAVFLGSSLALIITSLIGALAGGSISSLFPEELLEALAAVIFIYLGITLLRNALMEQKEIQSL